MVSFYRPLLKFVRLSGIRKTLYDIGDFYLSGLLSCFNAFVGPSYDDIPSHTVLSLLIKSLQKVVATLKESQSRQLIPKFLMFLGYEVSEISR